MRGMFLFQRDLRTEDQVGLATAISSCDEILLGAVFDSKLQKLSTKSPYSHNAIERFTALMALESHLRDMNIPLAVHVGSMVPWVLELCRDYQIEKVWLNQVYEPAYVKAYRELEEGLRAQNVTLICCSDDFGVPIESLHKGDGLVYKVFTPFYKYWRSHLNLEEMSLYIIPWRNINIFIELNTITSTSSSIKLSKWQEIKIEILKLKKGRPILDEDYYQNGWHVFLSEKIKAYDSLRDYPSSDGTSQLSVAINNGMISYRQLVREAYLNPDGEAFLRQLAWRQFYQIILMNFPNVEKESFREVYRNLVWPNNPELFQKWKDGQTGFPIVDAAMRQLKSEGNMHNRLRMVCASFLVKHLGVDWRLGEAYFYEMLRDGDLALNNGGWQWCASTGTDAQPYFRIFNPIRQAERYDSDHIYISRWIEDSVEPCVDLKVMSNWTIQHYKKAREGVFDSGNV